MKVRYQFVVVFSFLALGVQPVFAQQFSVLPYTNKTTDECTTVVNGYEATGIIPSQSDVTDAKFADANGKLESAKADLEKARLACVDDNVGCDKYNTMKTDINAVQQNRDAALQNSLADSSKAEPGPRDDLLGCAIKTGKISFDMIPYFITYIVNFLLSLVGLVCVLFIVLGGYYYVFGGLSEDKDKGKKTIEHALMGMALALLSWTIVNVILSAITH